MSDIWKKEPPSRPTAPDGDEEIIDLVEELPEENPRQPLSELERRLLDFGDPTPDAAADLPDLADLGSFDFDEEDDETPAGAEAGPGADAASTSAESADRPAARGNEIEEVSEFDEQLLEAGDILDVEEILAGPPPAKKEAEPETDEGLELLDIEEEEIDDEIVWFDDLDPAAPSSAPAAADAPPEATVLDWGTDPGRETSALDVFAAHVESALPETDMGPALSAAEAGAVTASVAAAAVFQPTAEPAPGASPPAAESAGAAAAPGLSSAEIEAAVERVLERKLGGTIESIIQQAIEKAVSKEIERLKRLLLEDDDRSPAS